MKSLFVCSIVLAGSSFAVLTVPELIQSYGYTPETHHVTTDDGYVLEMHRVTGSPSSPASPNKIPIFVMHGLLCSSADFVLMGPNSGPAFILADAGYDVWLGNARGNTWSKKNNNNLTYKQFWNFSWEEIGTKDLPVMIDYVLKTTGYTKIPYIGHSQGTTSLFVLLSMKPEYNAKISFFAALAPVAYLYNVKGPILNAARLTMVGGSVVDELMIELVGKEFLPTDGWIMKFAKVWCPSDTLSQKICSNLIFLVGGYDEAQLNISMLSTITSYNPAGSATKQLIHYGQEMVSGKFQRYDYGLSNVFKYGRLSPPDYNVSLMTVPVLVMYGQGDWLADPKDVSNFYRRIKNPIELYRVNYASWSHMDFLWGIESKKYVYDYLLTKLSEYINQ